MNMLLKKINKILFSTVFLHFFSIAAHESLIITKRQLCDIELLLNGGFAPLTGFMNQQDYNSVVENMRLADGTVWPMPIVLDVDEQAAKKLANQSQPVLQLLSPDKEVLAMLEISNIWQPDKIKEAQLVYGTTDKAHPGVAYLFDQIKDFYVGGTLKKVSLPSHYDFNDLRKTPEQLKQYFKEKGVTKVVGFQTRNPMHRAHVEMTRRAAEQVGAHLLLNPAVCMTKPGDIDHFTRVKSYKKIIDKYVSGQATLNLLEISMRMAGPREALWHAIIRRNYGCTHFIVGRDHAGPGKDSSGKDFYGPYDAQNLAKAYAHEIGIEIVPFQEMVYVQDTNSYMPINEVPQGSKVLSISGTQLRALLNAGLPIPEWFSYPEVVAELQNTYPPKHKQGFTVFFTGLSGAGKSTIANALAIKLHELQYRPISSLDGDEVRKHLSTELGFSKKHRSLNVRRVGFVAQEITKHGGIALCAMIAPYKEDREYNRSFIKQYGGFIEVYISTPLAVCEDRDVKGLYAKAREGKIPQFTGISDPYEAPINPELIIDTTNITIAQAVDRIVEYLRKEVYV